MSSTLAAVHFFGIFLCLFGVAWRAAALSQLMTIRKLDAVLAADNVYGAAILLVILTGFLRAFAGFEKGTEYYVHNHWFYAKMLVFVLIFALEVQPMIQLVQWRVQKRTIINDADGPRVQWLLRRTKIEMFFFLVLPFLATYMARGGPV